MSFNLCKVNSSQTVLVCLLNITYDSSMSLKYMTKTSELTHQIFLIGT